MQKVHVLQAPGCRRPCLQVQSMLTYSCSRWQEGFRGRLAPAHLVSLRLHVNAGEQILPHLGPSLLSLSSSPASRPHEACASRSCSVHKGLSTEQELNLREAKSCPVSFRTALTLRVFPGGASGKEPACQCRRCKRHGFHPWVVHLSLHCPIPLSYPAPECVGWSGHRSLSIPLLRPDDKPHQAVQSRRPG